MRRDVFLGLLVVYLLAVTPSQFCAVGFNSLLTLRISSPPNHSAQQTVSSCKNCKRCQSLMCRDTNHSHVSVKLSKQPRFTNAGLIRAYSSTFLKENQCFYNGNIHNNKQLPITGKPLNYTSLLSMQ